MFIETDKNTYVTSINMVYFDTNGKLPSYKRNLAAGVKFLKLVSVVSACFPAPDDSSCVCEVSAAGMGRGTMRAGAGMGRGTV